MAAEILPEMLRRLESVEPDVKSKKLAAVSVIIFGREPKTLLIKRAERLNDPWSGQVAFPGGKMVDGDQSAKQTAVRETREEVGVDLARDATFSGYHRRFRTHTGEMDVIPTVFLLKREVEVVPNEEVAGFRWVGLGEFLRPRSASTYQLGTHGASRDMPAYLVGDYMVWGLTHRIISSLLGRASA